MLLDEDVKKKKETFTDDIKKIKDKIHVTRDDDEKTKVREGSKDE